MCQDGRNRFRAVALALRVGPDRVADRHLRLAEVVQRHVADELAVAEHGEDDARPVGPLQLLLLDSGSDGLMWDRPVLHDERMNPGVGEQPCVAVGIFGAQRAEPKSGGVDVHRGMVADTTRAGETLAAGALRARLPEFMGRRCCDMMRKQLGFECDVHERPWDCPDAIVIYKYGLIVHDGGRSFIGALHRD